MFGWTGVDMFSMVNGRQVVAGSVATAVGLFGVVVALTCSWKLIRTTVDLGGGCTSAGEEGLPPCPPGVDTITVGALVVGFVALTIYLAGGLKIGPRLGVLMWPATLGPMLGTAGWYNYGLGGPDVDWGILAVAPEALAVIGGPAWMLLFSRRALRELVWSDGRGMLPAEDAPPTRKADPRLKLWSLVLQAVTIAAAIATGNVVYHQIVTT